MKYSLKMIILYNILYIFLLIIGLPFLLFKAMFNGRLRYKLRERFFPSTKINTDNYMLIHASSFGEIKTILDVVDIFKEATRLNIVFSVFTDSGFKLAAKENTILMPIDITINYRRIFKRLPKLALFFETEIWPAYIHFLKSHNVKIILINARMSDRSFSFYRKASFIFKNIIGMFDRIIAKSEEDAKKFSYFNNNVLVCGNLKQNRNCVNIPNDEKNAVRDYFGIQRNNFVVVFGSVHKEEIECVIDIISDIKDRVFCILALRHLEDLSVFEHYLVSNGMDYSKRTSPKKSGRIFILDTMGELESMYKASDVCVICGSMVKGIGGHNPLEPLFYNKYTICGPYMDSFSSEIMLLKKDNLIYQASGTQDLKDRILFCLVNKCTINAEVYFDSVRNIVKCYADNIKDIYS